MGDGKGGFNGKSDVTQEANISVELGDRAQVDEGQDSDEVCEEHVVSADGVSLDVRGFPSALKNLRLGILPLPEFVGP